MSFCNNRIKGASEKRCIHFIDDLLQATVENSKSDRVKCCHWVPSWFAVKLSIVGFNICDWGQIAQ